MLVKHLQIDGQSFYLEPDEDIDVLENLIIDGVRESPRFVRFRAAGYGRVSVLMTRRISIRFDIREIDDAEVAGWDDNPPVIDMHDF
jgi:hypothetical protein